MTDRELMQQALDWISRANAMDYEYRIKANEVLPALRERLAQKDEPSAEPVAYRYRYIDGWIECQPLYTVSPPRTPLMDDEIAAISVECAAAHKGDDISFARAIERAHGIGDKK